MKARFWSLMLALVMLSGCHCCQDELNMFFLGIPAVGVTYGWLKARLHHISSHKSCERRHKDPSNLE